MKFRLLLAIVMAVSLTAAACTSSSADLETATTAPNIPTQTVTTELPTQTVTTEIATETVTSGTPDGTGGSEPTSCEDLADDWIAITQEFINTFGAGPYEDWYGDPPSSELLAGQDVWFEKSGAWSETWMELECMEVERPFICERQSQLDALGPAGEAFIYDNTPCNLEGTFGPNSAAEARLNAWRESQL